MVAFPIMPIAFPPSPLWTADELRDATDGRWLKPPDRDWFPTGIMYGSEFARPGDIFLTFDSETHARAELIGAPEKSWDTANRLQRLAATGMACAIVQRDVTMPPPDGLPVLRVADSPLALQRLAVASRERLRGRVVSVTGTAGKTTTREMLRCLLAGEGAASSATSNFNTRLGVLLTLAQTPRETDYAVYELSINALQRGIYRTEPTADFHVRSDVAVFTSLGLAHTANADSLEGIADLKSRIFRHMNTGAAAVINRDMPLFDRIAGHARQAGVRRILTFGVDESADMRLLDWQGEQAGSFVRAALGGEDIDFYVPVPGRHMAINSLAALCAVAVLGGDLKKAAAALCDYRTQFGRLQQHNVGIPGGSFQLIDDAFNATPISLVAGLETMRLAQPGPGGRRIAVLGRIVELGDAGPRIMRDMAKTVLETGIDLVFTIHEELLDLRAALPGDILAPHAETTAELAASILDRVRPGDIVFAKASHRFSDFHLLPQYLRFGAPGRTPEPDTPPSRTAFLGGLLGRRDPAAIPELPVLAGPDPSICFLGDTYFGETHQAARRKRGKTNFLEDKGHAYGLRRFQKMLRKTDASIAMFRAPLTTREQSPFSGAKKWILRAEPAKSIKTLKEHNIRALSLASSNILDYGAEGLRHSLTSLSAQSMTAFGAGLGKSAAAEPLRLSLTIGDREEKIAVFAGLQDAERLEAKYGGRAIARRPRIADIAGTLAPAIARWRGDNPGQRIIAFVQWGAPYSWRNTSQTKIADRLIEAGADLIIGTGAHLCQEIERRQGKWVIYNLGNFVFGSDGLYKAHNAKGISMIARLTMATSAKSAGYELRLYPIITNNMLTLFQPRFLNYTEFRNFLEIMNGRAEAEGIVGPPNSGGRDEFGWYLELGM